MDVIWSYTKELLLELIYSSVNLIIYVRSFFLHDCLITLCYLALMIDIVGSHFNILRPPFNMYLRKISSMTM